MKNVDILAQYREYLITERDASENTMSSYMRDLRQLQEYLQQENGSTLQEVNDTDLQAYIEHLREAGKSVSTIARNIASSAALISGFRPPVPTATPMLTVTCTVLSQYGT